MLAGHYKYTPELRGTHLSASTSQPLESKVSYENHVEALSSGQRSLVFHNVLLMVRQSNCQTQTQNKISDGTVLLTCNPSTWEAETGQLPA